jgi:hypothetical protein
MELWKWALGILGATAAGSIVYKLHDEALKVGDAALFRTSDLTMLDQSKLPAIRQRQSWWTKVEEVSGNTVRLSVGGSTRGMSFDEDTDARLLLLGFDRKNPNAPPFKGVFAMAPSAKFMRAMRSKGLGAAAWGPGPDLEAK